MDREKLLHLLFERDNFLLHLDTNRRAMGQPTSEIEEPSEPVEPIPEFHHQCEIKGNRGSLTAPIKKADATPQGNEMSVNPTPSVPMRHDGTFSPLMAVARFPYRHVKGELSQKVASQFFDGGKFWERRWDLYYIQPPRRVSPRHILLVPMAQVRTFFQEINTALQCSLTLPSETQGLKLTFENPNFPSPKFLGQSVSRQAKDRLESQIPLGSGNISTPTGMDEEYLAYEKMLYSACSALKQKKTSKAKQMTRLQHQIRIVECLTRLQSYFGLRSQTEEEPAGDGDFTWAGKTYQRTVSERPNMAESGSPKKALDVTCPVPYPFWKQPVFVSVDVEANEHCHSEVTEVGLSVLDTEDLIGVAPGENAQQWRVRIKSRHLRVKEYAHIVNRTFLAGCPDRFEFGDSEWVHELDLGATVLAGLQPSDATEKPEPRHFVLVGHNIAMDLQYLREMGLRTDEVPAGTAGFIDVVDTADFFKVLRREESHRSLARVLDELQMTGWNLHNAGNDARYTMETIIGGGPGGLTLARLLERAGLNYVLFERDPSPEYTPRFQGGTLDLTQEGGQLALQRAGLTTEFEKLARRDATTITIQNALGNHRITVGGEDNDRPEIDRRQLRRLLLDSIPAHRIRWGKTLQSAERPDNQSKPEAPSIPPPADWVLRFADGTCERGFRLIVGADGAWSKLRRLITPAIPQYSGKTFIEGRLSRDNPIYAAAVEMVGAGNSLAIGAGRCLCIQQMSDRSYRVYMGLEAAETLTQAGGAADVADMETARATVQRMFSHWAPHLQAFIAAAESPWRPWPLYRLDAEVFHPSGVGDGKGWTRTPGVVLLGDAAHVTTPNGEGVNQAMLDAVVLSERICAELCRDAASVVGYDPDTDAAALERAIVAYETDMRARAYESVLDSLKMEEMMYGEDGAKQMIEMFEKFGG
ncbi:hypothetical protein BDV59DRAFT_190949 [Aspergillus ambiguus]|uniref:uncharacterized protein n=1 Tax=Aspergillus ambiguus TaxID=176160 RepID=UPI003CCD57F1